MMKTALHLGLMTFSEKCADGPPVSRNAAELYSEISVNSTQQMCSAVFCESGCDNA